MEPLRGSPEIEYPTIWSYTLIGWREKDMRAAVHEYMGDDAAYKLTFSHFSRKGTYISLHLEIEVESEAERNATYVDLKAMPAIRLVM
ncbi:MAG: DUF493 domain-containing protein [Planctomycetes bacterium]|nr:DUF493 domain-containing protein [Planctomycetota bacterium]MCB9890159.1 DUF493 domain-containing protein [Planctomycetota bacterium]MCB9917977.1 DUF493 domain-containing protein [Planctomycetota bacterium]